MVPNITSVQGDNRYQIHKLPTEDSSKLKGREKDDSKRTRKYWPKEDFSLPNGSEREAGKRQNMKSTKEDWWMLFPMPNKQKMMFTNEC